METTETKFTAGQTITLRREIYETKIWEVDAMYFDYKDTACSSDGRYEKRKYTLSEKEAERLNSQVDGDNVLNTGLILTKKGFRLYPY